MWAFSVLESESCILKIFPLYVWIYHMKKLLVLNVLMLRFFFSNIHENLTQILFQLLDVFFLVLIPKDPKSPLLFQSKRSSSKAKYVNLIKSAHHFRYVINLPTASKICTASCIQFSAFCEP